MGEVNMMADVNAVPTVRFKGQGAEVFDIHITGLRVCMFYEGLRKAAKNQNKDMQDIASGEFKIDMEGGGVQVLIGTVDSILKDCPETVVFAGNLAYPTYLDVIQQLTDIVGKQMTALSGVPSSKKELTNSEE